MPPIRLKKYARTSGLIVAPTSVIVATPFDCTWCSDQNCKNADGTPFGTNADPDPNFHWRWVKKYCSYSNEFFELPPLGTPSFEVLGGVYFLNFFVLRLSFRDIPITGFSCFALYITELIKDP